MVVALCPDSTPMSGSLLCLSAFSAGGNILDSTCFLLKSRHLSSRPVVMEVFSTYDWQTSYLKVS